MNCRHCKKRRVCKPRGLCQVCYGRTAIRDLHPVGTTRARGDVLCRGDFEGDAEPPTDPTTAPAGSAEKLRVMVERARNKQELFHDNENPQLLLRQRYTRPGKLVLFAGAIVEAFLAGVTQTELAKRYGVSVSSMSDFLKSRGLFCKER